MNWGAQPRWPAPTGSSWEPSARVNSNSETSGCQGEPIIFLSFLHSAFRGGWRRGPGRLAKSHLRPLFNETIHVQDRVTCIKYTRLLIHFVIKQGIALGC